MTILSLQAKQDHLEKIAKTSDPIKAISEFVWNALDADATEVAVNFVRNPLDGIQEIRITDNGIGISRNRGERDFANLGESWKRDKRKTAKLQRALHGKEGRGRLRFYSLADFAVWKSTYQQSGKFFDLTIKIAAGALEKSDLSEAVPSEETKTGTSVELAPLKAAFDWLVGREARLEFTTLFAPYILQYPNLVLTYDGHRIDPKETIAHEYEFPKQTVIGPTKTIKDLIVRVIEWNSHIEARKIHLGGESGVILGSLPSNVVAPGFEYSAYAYSAFFQEMANDNFLEMEGLTDPNFQKVMERVRDQLGEYFRVRQSERAKGLIEELIDAGAYPYEGAPKDEIEKRERQVFDIATYAVSSYSKDFKSAETSLKRMTLTLLREALRHNPEALSNILRAVVNLPKTRQDEFSSLLEKTELGNIIAASSLIADRVMMLETLRGMVFNPAHRSTIKERGQLDTLIRDNTWIFGEHFHITMAEAGLTRVIERVAEDNHSKRKKGKVVKPDGKSGRTDCFLGRMVPHPDQNKREYLVMELKRPSIVVGRKETDQLEDYVRALRDQPDFKHTDTFWHFYLITGDYGDDVKDRITQAGRAVGLYLEKDNFKIWIKTWPELIRECEGRLKFIQDQLKIDISDDEIERRIGVMKDSLVAGDNRKVVRFPDKGRDQPQPSPPQ
jgi:hypothetical protein